MKRGKPIEIVKSEIDTPVDGLMEGGRIVVEDGPDARGSGHSGLLWTRFHGSWVVLECCQLMSVVLLLHSVVVGSEGRELNLALGRGNEKKDPPGAGRASPEKFQCKGLKTLVNMKAVLLSRDLGKIADRVERA